MKKFSINLEGRIKNFSLPKNQPLLPLFEAIVNAIHSIEDRMMFDNHFSRGKISIEVIRDDEITIPGMPECIQPISGFVIKDNGIGFNDENLTSFMESDSTYKASKGGKGVGRFSWLKAFKKAVIKSVYRDNNHFVRRQFEFSNKNTEIDDALVDCNDVFNNSTSVTLQSYLPEYRKHVPKQGHTIAIKIIEHCLVYFLSDSCPRIFLLDTNEDLCLNDIFEQTIKTEENSEKFEINGIEFNLLNVKMDEPSLNGNKLFLCANNRVVDEKELDKLIVDLDKQMFSRHGFYYIGVLTGSYLDKNVDMNRLSFSIPEKSNNEEFYSEVSMEKILQESCDIIEEYLKDYLDPIKNEKKERIKKYVSDEAPQFRHLLKYMPAEIDAIKPNLTNDKLDDELHKIKRKFDKEIKEENNQLLKQLIGDKINNEGYQEKFNQQVSKISDANRSVLADYVAHRKIIIDLLENGIRKQEDDKFNKENYIHNLIYPMRTTSEETDYENHNLWIIDEKLAYCSYISSDIPFNNDNKEKRTDIMVLNSPVAISEDENDGSEFDTIVIFELKRPMRDDYTDAENPIDQLYNYAEKIIDGNAKDKNGRFIQAGSRTKFYLYAVCDITPSLKRIIRRQDFIQTPDKMGYYKYNETYKAYVEILPFNKMIRDSKKRNKILFDKLGI